MVNVGVAVAVGVGVSVGVDVTVGVGVIVGVGVSVSVAVGVEVVVAVRVTGDPNNWPAAQPDSNRATKATFASHKLTVIVPCFFFIL